MKTVKPGDQIMVPNVEAFDLASVKNIKPGSEISSHAANEMEDQPGPQTPNPGESAGAPGNVAITVDTKTNILEVREGEKLVATYQSPSARAYRLAYRRMEGARDRQNAYVSLGQGNAQARRTEREFLSTLARAAKSCRRDVDRA